jgi:hypothetical protein
MVSRRDQARAEIKRTVRWMFDRIEEMRRQRHIKEKLTIKKPGIRGVKYVSNYNSQASPLSQYNEFMNY